LPSTETTRTVQLTRSDVLAIAKILEEIAIGCAMAIDLGDVTGLTRESTCLDLKLALRERLLKAFKLEQPLCSTLVEWLNEQQEKSSQPEELLFLRPKPKGVN
jgi:hypothetical protein